MAGEIPNPSDSAALEESEIEDNIIPEQAAVRQASELLHTSINGYLARIGNIAEPTREQTLEIIETLLSSKTELAALGGEHNNSPHQLLASAAVAKRFQTAKYQLIYYNLPFAARVAKASTGQPIFRNSDLARLQSFATIPSPLEDRIQAANLGLVDAVTRLSPPADQGPMTGGELYRRYRSYITARVVGELIDHLYVETGLPKPWREKISHVRRTESQLAQKLGRSPSKEELRAELQTTGLGGGGWEKALEEANYFATKYSIREKNYRNKPVDAAGKSPERVSIMRIEDSDLAVRALNGVKDERQRQVLTLFYGFFSAPMTLEDIGSILGVSEERVSQIRDRALAHIRKAMYQDEGLQPIRQNFEELKKRLFYEV